jgi:long-subunit acyl-CoA synthetase (AMP-forming)
VSYIADTVKSIQPLRGVSSLTYKELRTTTSQLAAGLRKIGLRVGDRVLLAGPNCLYYSSIILATMGAGGCFVSAPSDFETNEFQHCIATALPKVIIAHPTVLAKLPATLGDHELLFVLDDSDEGAKWPRNDALGTWRHWTRLLDCDIDTTATWLEYSPVQAAETTALICMTSGYAI